MTTKSLFRQTLDEIPAETHIFIKKYTDILDRVQTILDRRGMKRRDLALALGKSESEISKWLAGKQGNHNFTLRSIAKLEAVLGEEILVIASNDSQTQDLSEMPKAAPSKKKKTATP